MSIRRRPSRAGLARMKATGCRLTDLPDDMLVWLCDYRDAAGHRRAKQFWRKAQAKAFLAQATVDIAAGRHVAESQSKTVAQAAAAWIERCEKGDPTADPPALEPATWVEYQRHMTYATDPTIGIGGIKLTKLSATDVDSFLLRLREHPTHRRSAATAQSPNQPVHDARVRA